MTCEEALKLVVKQQIVISQQRAALKRQHNARLAIVAGEYADQIDPDAEALKQIEMSPSVEADFKLLIETLSYYGDPSSYQGSVMQDKGAKARAVLAKIA